MSEFTLMVGTAGTSVWFSYDLGENLGPAPTANPDSISSHAFGRCRRIRPSRRSACGHRFRHLSLVIIQSPLTHLPSPFDADCTWRWRKTLTTRTSSLPAPIRRRYFDRTTPAQPGASCRCNSPRNAFLSASRGNPDPV